MGTVLVLARELGAELAWAYGLETVLELALAMRYRQVFSRP